MVPRVSVECAMITRAGFNLMQEEVIHKVRNMGKRIGIIKDAEDEDDDESDEDDDDDNFDGGRLP